MARSISSKDVDDILNSTIEKVEETKTLSITKVKDVNAGKVRFVKGLSPHEIIVLPNGKEIELDFTLVQGRRIYKNEFFVNAELAGLVREVANKYGIVE